MLLKNKIIILFLIVILFSTFITFVSLACEREENQEQCFLVIGEKSRNYSKKMPISCKKEITDLGFTFLKNLPLKENAPNFISIECIKNRSFLNFSKEIVILHTGKQPDSDGDGLSDSFELELGTDPYAADSDKDGIPDGKEYIFWGENHHEDFDKDGIPNLLDPASSGNEILDSEYLFYFRDFIFMVLPPADSVKKISWVCNKEPDIDSYKVFIRRKGEEYDFSFPIWEGNATICLYEIFLKESECPLYAIVGVFDKKGQHTFSEEIEINIY